MVTTPHTPAAAAAADADVVQLCNHIQALWIDPLKISLAHEKCLDAASVHTLNSNEMISSAFHSHSNLGNDSLYMSYAALMAKVILDPYERYYMIWNVSLINVRLFRDINYLKNKGEK